MGERGARARRAAAAVAVLVVVGAQPAGADDVTTEELRRLVEQAPSDPGAVEALRRVDRVDGRPYDLGRALDGSEGRRLQERVRALDPGRGPGAGGGPGITGGAVRAEAREILEDRRFDRSSVPRPLQGLLRRMGGWLRPVTEPIGRLWDDVTGNALATGLVGGLVVALAAFVAARLIARRTSAGLRRERAERRRADGDDPDALERAAADAERAGDLEWAVRLRFRAGLLRLHRAGAIVDRPALTTGELTRSLALPHLRDLTTTFEQVAYGRRPATPDDVDAARQDWPRVLEEAARR